MSSLSASNRHGSFEEALSGIMKDSPTARRDPFGPVKRQAEGSPACSPELTSSAFASPIHKDVAQFPSHAHETSPIKGQTIPLAAHTKAKMTPMATIKRKIGLSGAERIGPSYTTPRVPSRAATATPRTVHGADDALSRSSATSEGSIDSDVTSRAGKDNVLVCIRVRPAVPVGHSALTSIQQRALAGKTHDEAWMADEGRAKISALDGTAHEFRYDSVVTGSGNQNVYVKAARNLVLSAMSGYDACVFAYGQTASGKTFTLTGTPTNPGVIPQAVADVFAFIRSHPDQEFLLRASFLEIYNEQLKDLLAPETEGQVKIRQDADKRFFVSPLHEEIVTCEAQVADLLRRGDKTRHTAGTDFNSRSSRSHTVFTMVIESRDALVPGSVPTRPPSRGAGLRGGPMLDDGCGGAVRMSRLSLIDLAGSEKATSQADRRMEGAFINRSLLTLEIVIGALTEDKTRTHVPYRDSKLTQLLQPSLSGEARVAVICTINPSVTAVEESKSTLKFAARVKKVTLHAEKREILDDKALIHKYRAHIAELKAQLAAKNAESQVPPTPRSMPDESERAAQVAAVKELEEKINRLHSLFLTAQNIDKKRDVPARPVSPEKPAIRETAHELHERLLDAQDKMAEAEETISRLNAELQQAYQELSRRPPVPENTSLEAKDQLIATLSKERQQLEIVLSNQDRDYDLAVKRAQRAAEREWSAKYDALKSESEAKQAIEDDLREKLNAERKRLHQLERYSINVLRRDVADRLGSRTLAASLDASASARGPGSFGDDVDAMLLPQICDESPDLDFFSSAFMSRLDLTPAVEEAALTLDERTFLSRKP